MKTFTCSSCGARLFFENFKCLQCGSTLAYLPHRNELATIETDSEGVFRSSEETAYRLCKNSLVHNVCNEAVPIASPSNYCLSCQLTEVVPALFSERNRKLWYQLEMNKRRLIFGLRTLGLMPQSKKEDPVGGLSFRFLDDLDGSVMTGHQNGVITITLEEADDAIRESRRQQLGEPARSLIGHFRHEVGHYYWDRLIQLQNRIPQFRNLFGDESLDYAQALKDYYLKADDNSWRKTYISRYATAHPWEDWAETFSHYLYIYDVTETAIAVGLLVGTGPVTEMTFDDLLGHWFPVVLQLNELGKSSGKGPLYPYVLNESVREKLRFIDALVRP